MDSPIRNIPLLGAGRAKPKPYDATVRLLCQNRASRLNERQARTDR